MKDTTLLSNTKSFFAEGTLIFTTDGYKLIEQLVAGDEVLTHKGRFRKVLKCERNTADTLIKLRGFGVDELVCTANQLIYVKKKIF